jgi:hypothetical protein
VIHSLPATTCCAYPMIERVWATGSITSGVVTRCMIEPVA